MDTIYVRISETVGRNGGFATSETPCWKVDLFNDDTRTAKEICSGMNEWSTYHNKQKAEDVAEEWAKFLGCDVRHFKVVPRTTFEHVEVDKP